ncbi:hypothetical protein C8Q75DRAFT_736737 [Abortiporus biennis]|nr:hypothetical protein C8Q75DRAFT_736737 [Abortiporus biennis]
MPAQAKTHVLPKSSTHRPALPTEHFNPNLTSMDTTRPPVVKFQEIMRDGQATIVGRVKIPTPTGHAFILRRLDTGAISLTTMFRAAFPSATDEQERQEAIWVKSNFDIAGANKTGKARFAGTWVAPEIAIQLSDSYALRPIIEALAASSPDPNVVYRKGVKGSETPTGFPAAPSAPANVASPKEPAPPPAKRRREISPTKTPVSKVTATPSPAYTSSAATGASPAPSYISNIPTSASKSRPPPSSTTRRSTRLRSPAPTSTTSTLIPKTPKTTKAMKGIREEVTTPAGSDETAVDEDAHEAAKVAEVNMVEDVREQKELIERLKAERAAKVQAQGEDESMEEDVDGAAQKRAREEGPYKLNIEEKPEETEERAIASNRRVLGQMPPERKSLAWGALLFAAGLGAMSLIPSIPNPFM